jgi:signal transduction histidine kinase
LFAGRIPTYRRELQTMHADGSPIDVDARISLIRGDDGRPQAFLTQLIDITARRLAERERDAATAQLVQRNGQLEQSNRGLLAANQLKLDLMGMLSHEIGNPLTAIAEHAEVLFDLLPADLPATDQRLRSVQAILRCTERLATMRHEILTMCALDTGDIVANREPVNLCSAIAQALAATELTVPVSCTAGLVALVSPSHLQHILISYLTNAGKYAGGATGVSASSSPDWIEIRVRDEGPGVEPPFQTHLFERFTRGSDAGARAQGTGLGLYIVHGLAEANDGTFWYEPNSPTGSVFVVRLRRLQSGNAAT